MRYYEKDYALRSKVYDAIRDGMQITFTTENLADGDDFLILDEGEECVVTFHTNSVPYWVDFSNDEPMLLEDCPDSFYESILKNAK